MATGTNPDEDDLASQPTHPWLGQPSQPTVRVSDAPVRALDFAERYERVADLGEGGMGVVALCSDRQIGRRVAMKRMHGDYARTEVELRFLREARIQGQLEHPAILPVYDLGVDPDGSVYFTMKRVRGITLEALLHGLDDTERTKPRLEQESYSLRRMLTAFSSVCLAVDFAHRRGVIHRDLKPANIMLGDFGEVYVLDWGLARVDDAGELAITSKHAPVSLPAEGHAQTAHGAVMGTPGYMAPEQVAGETELVGPRADVYALGAILFEILTGKRLHPEDDVLCTFAATVQGVEARPSVRAPEARVPPELEELMVRATAVDPDERCASARELHQAVERHLDGERDHELRRQLSSNHAKTAAEAAELASTEQSEEFVERRRAMREIGHALALDPDNPQAMEVLVNLLRHPPKHAPVEVRLELGASDRHRLRWVARIGAGAYAIVFVFLPLIMWTGVRSWGATLLFFGLLGAASIASWMASRARDPMMLTITTLLLSNLAFACTAPFFGPLLVMPTLAAINTTAFVAYLPSRLRLPAVLVGCGSILAPFGLMRAGVLAAYGFSPAGMLIVPSAVELTATATTILLVAIALGGVLVGSYAVTRIRDALDITEKQLFMYAWHMRELIPEAARGPTDPTAARRLRQRTVSKL